MAGKRAEGGLTLKFQQSFLFLTFLVFVLQILEEVLSREDMTLCYTLNLGPVREARSWIVQYADLRFRFLNTAF